MRLLRLIGALLLIASSLVAVGATPALAQPPANDVVENATMVEALPFSDVLDTSEATTDEVDAALNQNCGAPSTDASVWYTVVVEEQSAVEVQVFESSYSAGVIIATGSPGSLELVNCGPEAVLFFAEPGVTYWVLAFDDQLDGGGNGGTLVINIDSFVVEPPPEIELNVDPVGTFDPRSGGATISGTFTCTGFAEFIELFGEARQRAGRLFVRGFFSLFSENGGSPLACDGETQAWTVHVTADNGSFAGGNVDVTATVFACGFFDCTEQTIEQRVRLRGSQGRG